MPIQPGSKVGRYQIKAIIGKGGMAVVYRAFDTRLKRDVAIKFIRMDQFGPSQWPQIRRRFEREALVMAKLDHPHIIKVFDYGEFEGTPYLVMQLVEGGSLKQRIGKPIPWQDAVQQIKPIAEALEYAHEQGVVHRDVKPGNILLTKKGSPLLADFGIAKIVESTGGDSLTSSGVGMGTPEYMAPEQAVGGQVDQRVDVYSLGVILYELITNRRPYVADTPLQVVIKQSTEPFLLPSKIALSLPRDVEKIILKALARKPGDRFADMSSFIEALKVVQLNEKKHPKINKKSPSIEIIKSQTIADLVSLEGSQSAIKADVLSRSNYSERGLKEKKLSVQNVISPENARQIELLATLEICNSWVYSIDFSPDNKRIAAGCGDNLVRIWDIVNIQPIGTLKAHKSHVLCVRHSKSGKYLASGSNDMSIALWDSQYGELLASLRGHTGAVFCVEFSVNGDVLISTSADNTIKLWDIKKGTVIHTLLGHRGCVVSAAVAPNGKLLASGSDDNTIKI